MYGSKHHMMVLETTHPAGAEEWFCPTCGRRFLMHWSPAYKKIVLAPGDEYASHSGGMAGPDKAPRAAEDGAAGRAYAPRFGAVEYPGADSVDDTPAALTDELLPWLKWMKDAGLADG